VDSATRPNLTWLLVLAAAGLSLFVFGCGGGTDEPTNGTQPGGHHHSAHGHELPTIELPSLWDAGSADRLGTLIGSADVVFRGNIVTLKGQRTALSQPGGAESGAPRPRWGDMPVSQFEVLVESVVSGSITPGTSVTLEQLGGVQTGPDGTRVRLMLEGDEPIEVGQTYLLFGSFQDDGSLVVAPFGRMKVGPHGSLAAEPGWEHLGALADLSRRNLGDAERQISVTAGE
jgi:hypothetical protein